MPLSERGFAMKLEIVQILPLRFAVEEASCELMMCVEPKWRTTTRVEKCSCYKDGVMKLGVDLKCGKNLISRLLMTVLLNISLSLTLSTCFLGCCSFSKLNVFTLIRKLHEALASTKLVDKKMLIPFGGVKWVWIKTFPGSHWSPCLNLLWGELSHHQYCNHLCVCLCS